MAGGTREAKVALTTSNRKLDKGLLDARNKLTRWADKSKRSIRKRFSGLLSGMGGKLLGLAGIGGIAAIGKDVLGFEKRLTRLQIQSGRSGAAMGVFRDQVGEVSRATGQMRGDLLDGAAAYVSLTGDMDGAQAGLKVFARVATASGASMEDITRTAAALKQNLNIDPAQFEKAFSIMLAQGKMGAIELRELSGLLSSIAPSFSKFGVTGTEGLAELGSMLQLTRQGFGGAAEAVTGLQGMMTSFQKNAKRFRKGGVEIFETVNGEKKMRRLSDIVRDLGNSKLAKDPTALLAAFGRVEGKKAFDELIKVPGALDDLITKTRAANDVAKDFDTYQQSTAGKLATAYSTLKTAIAEAFTPERIEGFVSALAKMAGLLGTTVAMLEAAGGLLSNYSKGVDNEKNFLKDAQQRFGKEEGGRLYRAWKKEGSGLSAEKFAVKHRREAITSMFGITDRADVARVHQLAGGKIAARQESPWRGGGKRRDQEQRISDIERFPGAGLPSPTRMDLNVTVDDRGGLKLEELGTRNGRRMAQ